MDHEVEKCIGCGRYFMVDGPCEERLYHECDTEKLVRYQVAEFERAFYVFMASADGRFSAYLARRAIG